jgi:3-hydroxyacyl-CoA dehydrogenase
MAKSEAISKRITLGSYEEDLEREVAGADLVLEAVSEQLALKRELFARVDHGRAPHTIVATVSSGLSIAAMCEGRSPGFRRHFLGVHLFNPPNVIVGCELIPHADTLPEVTRQISELLAGPLGRALIVTRDTPAFCGNRVGFKVLNECAQLAEEHGTAYLDALIGPHTGRAMPPLATIDFVGWDVHQAIVDNLHAHTHDEAHARFALPAYMAGLIEHGHLGNKVAELGGFYRTVGKGKEAQHFVLDPKTHAYAPAGRPPVIEVARAMASLHRVGRYRAAFDVFAEATGPDAERMRRVILGYVSYGLGRVGDVVERAADVDRIMGYGFNWAPPSVLVDLIGARRTLQLLEASHLPVPRVVADAAATGARLFEEPTVDIGRFFQGGS